VLQDCVYCVCVTSLTKLKQRPLVEKENWNIWFILVSYFLLFLTKVKQHLAMDSGKYK